MDAAEIINSASARKSRVEVRGVERKVRNPHREITVVEMRVPPCERYPTGKTWYVHPRQVDAHKRLFGARVVRELKRTMLRGAKPSAGPAPRGHRGRQEILDEAARAGHNFDFTR